MDMNRHPLLIIASASARFAARRQAARIRKEPEIETLIVDIDRTLTDEDSAKLALEKLCGKDKAHDILKGFAAKVKKGGVPLDGLHALIFKEIYGRGFLASDWGLMMEETEMRGGFRQGLIDGILRLEETRGIIPVLATRGSAYGARWVARRFGFRYALGSVERFDGKGFAGFERIVGARDGVMDGTRIITKVTAASGLLETDGLALDPAKTAVLSNDLLDALEMLACARGVLLLAKKPNSLELMTRRLMLYDAAITDGEGIWRDLRTALGLGGQG